MTREERRLPRWGGTELTRRMLINGAVASGISAGAATMLATHGAAQDATPDASPVVAPSTSMTRADYHAALRETFDLSEAGATGGTLILGDTGDIRTFQPHVATDSAALSLIQFVYQRLADASPIDGQPRPSLADSWEMAGDGVTYTFHLNPNATWHDGQPVTADDVVFSFDSILDEQSLSTRTSRVAPALASYRAIDETTIEMVGFAPSATFLEDTAMQVYILPRHVWQDVPVGEWGSDPGGTGTDPSRVVGSGPFRFVEWVINDHVTLERNADYWNPDEMPVLDQFIRRVFPEESSKVAAVQTGGAEIISVSSSQVDALQEANPDLTVTSYPTLSFMHYYCNLDPEKSPFFSDVRVRQAMMYALDRQLIADTIYQGYAQPATGTQPELSVAYRPDEITTVYTYDPEKAKALLDEAGWVEGSDGIREKDGVRFSFETMFSESSQNYANQIPYMQQAWREVGIEQNPAAMPFPSIVDLANAGDFDMVMGGFTWNVNGDQSVMYACDSAPPQGYNRMGYCNERFDELDALQRVELDPEKRISYLVEQTNIVNDELASSVILFTDGIFASAPKVHNFHPNGYDALWSLPYIWMEQ
jgi:peptide/nickel transport system substrate-binding protein